MLNLAAVYDGIQRLADTMVEAAEDRADRRERTVAAFERHGQRAEWLARRADAARTSWLVARLEEPPGARYDPPPAPAAHTVVAADGSQVFADRHAAAPCFLINLGRVRLSYSDVSSAALESRPVLFTAEEDVFRGEVGERRLVGPEEVSALRAVLELEALLELAQSVDGEAVALCDGTLIPWGWATARDGSTADSRRLALLDRYFAAIDGFAALGVPLAGFISRTGAADVTHLVRVGDCDQEPVDCDHCPHLAAVTARMTARRSLTLAEAVTLPCGTAAGLSDADLFGCWLAPGQRSAVFGTRSSVYHDRPERQRVAFFYLRVGDEVSRVELPQAVAERPESVARVHAVILDQARKGGGYPVALREAHEQAVVRAADREAFERLIERSLVRHGHAVRHSAKRRAKQQPGV